MNGKVHERRGWRIEVRTRYGDFGDRETAESVFRALARSGLFVDGSRLLLLGPDEVASRPTDRRGGDRE